MPRDSDFLEKAAVLGLAAPTAAMVGTKAAQSIDKPNSYEVEKEYRDRMRGKNYGAIDREDKLEEIRRSIEPSGGDTPSTGRPKVMKKGGFVHHSEHYRKHAAGHKIHQEHVKTMCGGGMAKGKK